MTSELMEATELDDSAQSIARAEIERSCDAALASISNMLATLSETAARTRGSMPAEQRILRLVRALRLLEERRDAGPDDADVALRGLKRFAVWCQHNANEAQMEKLRPLVRRYLDELKATYS